MGQRQGGPVGSRVTKDGTAGYRRKPAPPWAEQPKLQFVCAHCGHPTDYGWLYYQDENGEIWCSRVCAAEAQQ
jgi:hypothetical protein